jgi:hypothetical protein
MNTELLVRNTEWSSNANEKLVRDRQEMGPAVFSSQLSDLQDLLKQLGPLPRGALLFGLASDGLPVLLNLWNPLAGAVLVTGDADAEMTRLLQAIARFVDLTHSPNEIQYAVLTDRPHKWLHQADPHHCIGVFAPRQKDAHDLVQALMAWSKLAHNPQQSILLLADELPEQFFADDALGISFKSILIHGPQKRIWPIVASGPGIFRGTQRYWTRCFHTQIFGHTRNTCYLRAGDGTFPSELDTPSKGMEFVVKANTGLVRFTIA